MASVIKLVYTCTRGASTAVLPLQLEVEGLLWQKNAAHSTMSESTLLQNGAHIRNFPERLGNIEKYLFYGRRRGLGDWPLRSLHVASPASEKSRSLVLDMGTMNFVFARLPVSVDWLAGPLNQSCSAGPCETGKEGLVDAAQFFLRRDELLFVLLLDFYECRLEIQVLQNPIVCSEAIVHRLHWWEAIYDAIKKHAIVQ